MYITEKRFFLSLLFFSPLFFPELFWNSVTEELSISLAKIGQKCKEMNYTGQEKSSPLVFSLPKQRSG